MTLKKALLRGFLGVPIGVFISYTITIAISFFYFDLGVYNPVVPQLSEAVNNEITAVLIQYLLSGLLGFAFSVGSAVFQVEEWSITKQTGIHLMISMISLFPVAYICYWMDRSFGGIVTYVLTFVVFYVIIGFIKIRVWKNKINRINQKIQSS